MKHMVHIYKQEQNRMMNGKQIPLKTVSRSEVGDDGGLFCYHVGFFF